MVTAALGGEFEVPTIDGSKARVKVPAGTQSGRRFRLQGKGMPVLRSKQTGDMYVQVVVETPQNLTKRQRELLAEFEKLSSEDTQPEAAGFFGEVKEFLDRSGEVGAAIPVDPILTPWLARDLYPLVECGAIRPPCRYASTRMQQ